MSAGDFGLEDGERFCDGDCGRVITVRDQANPVSESEAFCSECWDGVPHDFGEGETVRIPVETNAQVVYGAEVV